MKRQVDFDIRYNTFSAGGLNGAYTPAQLVAILKDKYPSEDGWQLDKCEHVQFSVDGETVLLVFTKWADDVVSTKAK